MVVAVPVVDSVADSVPVVDVVTVVVSGVASSCSC